MSAEAPGRLEPTATLTEQFKGGLAAPICLTWELTYACNLQCVHCLSASGRRDPRELSTRECMAVVDELERMQVFYANIGGGEPTLRPDFWDLLDYSIAHHVGIKFSTNGVRLDKRAARRLAGTDYVDVQISIDGATAEVNDAVRGAGSFAVARRAMDNLAEAGFGEFKISLVVTRHNVSQLDRFKQMADAYGARLRVTRLRPSGRAADSWDDLHPTAAQQHLLYDWLTARPDVLTGDSFFHLSGLGAPLPGLNLCGAGRVVCLIDPVGDVYACPFVLHSEFRAGNVRDPGGRLAQPQQQLRFTPHPGCCGCASRPPPAPARPAVCSTPARAGAWRRSSSPGCRWTARIRSACSGTASASWRRCACRTGRGRDPGTPEVLPPSSSRWARYR